VLNSRNQKPTEEPAQIQNNTNTRINKQTITNQNQLKWLKFKNMSIINNNNSIPF
jgi:hypothetical protein